MIHDEIALPDSSRVSPDSKTDSFYPTRLIYVGDSIGGICRLIESGSDGLPDLGAKPLYVALSYCWGPPEAAARQFKTLNSTYSAYSSGFRPEATTSLIHDAILLVQTLGIPYLWVDAICIIQDSKTDWEQESKEMARVYRNAHLTICTTGSASCRQGFMDRSMTVASIRFSSKIDKCVNGRFNIRCGSPTENHQLSDMDSLRRNVKMSFWSTRAWTFQECSLSRRILFIGTNRIYFVTPNRSRIEGDSEAVADSWDEIDLGSRLIPGYDHHEEQEAWDYNRQYAIYSFSRLSLTVASDKLPAFSGIASLAYGSHPDRYLAGLWKDSLYKDLFWAADPFSSGIVMSKQSLLDAMQCPNQYIAPSWSWASRPHGVDFLAPNFGSSKFHDWSSWRPEYDSLEAWASPAGLNPFGEVTSGGVRITGRAVNIPHETYLLKDESWRNKRYKVIMGNRYFAYIRFDWNVWDESDKFTGMLMVLIGSCIAHDDNDQMEASAENTGNRDNNSYISESEREDTASYDLDSTLACRAGARYAWGIVVHPAMESGKYIRVGLFSSWPKGKGGLECFQSEKVQTIEII
jgi:hypothetical protein